jgi:thioester reductase-like protein
MARKVSEITEEDKMVNPLDVINEEKEEDVERDPDLYKVYKKIAMKTHPDRVKDESLVDFFDQATQAMKENDWMATLSIALALDIKTPEFTEELRQKLQANILEIKTKVKNLHNTAAWVWANTAEENKEKIRKSIRAMMGINEKEFLRATLTLT